MLLLRMGLSLTDLFLLLAILATLYGIAYGIDRWWKRRQPPERES